MSPNFKPTDRLIEMPLVPLGQRVPEPLHERIEELCDLAYEAGERKRPTKQEMLAALIFGGPDDPDELRQLLQRYGEAEVAEALPQMAASEGTVIALPRRKSGPRSPGRAGAVVHQEDPSR